MNNRKAKLLRKLTYADKDFRDKKYGRTPKGSIVTIEPYAIMKLGKKNQKVSLKRLYKHAKKVSKNISIKKLQKQATV